MIGPTGAVRVLVATKAVDFRKGAKGLAALVRCRPSKSASSGPPVSPGTDRRNPRTDRPAWSREMVVDIDDHDRIGEDTGERLDIVPAQFRVLVMRWPKYACRACENVVVQAPAPNRLIESTADRRHGGPGPGLQICRPPPTVPAVSDLRPPGQRS